MSPTFNLGIMLPEETTINGDSVFRATRSAATLPYVTAKRMTTSSITRAVGFFLNSLKVFEMALCFSNFIPAWELFGC
jgi:hypothetical protein